MTPIEFTTEGAPNTNPAPAAGRGLELIDLRRTYGATVALDGLGFTVEPGQMMGFVGPNGAGKTTAMRIVLGVLEPNSGEVRWNGRPVDRAARRRCLFAVSGAIAARQEDLLSTTAPLSMVLLAALFGAIFVTNSPDSDLGTVGTLVPFTAPLILPVRIATGDVAAWRIVAALLITLGSGVVLIRLAGRLYSGGILRTGGTVKLKEAWASASS